MITAHRGRGRKWKYIVVKFICYSCSGMLLESRLLSQIHILWIRVQVLHLRKQMVVLNHGESNLEDWAYSCNSQPQSRKYTGYDFRAVSHCTRRLQNLLWTRGGGWLKQRKMSKRVWTWFPLTLILRAPKEMVRNAPIDLRSEGRSDLMSYTPPWAAGWGSLSVHGPI